MTYTQETAEQYRDRIQAAAQVAKDTQNEYDLLVASALRGDVSSLASLLLSAANAGYLKGRNA